MRRRREGVLDDFLSEFQEFTTAVPRTHASARDGSFVSGAGATTGVFLGRGGRLFPG